MTEERKVGRNMMGKLKETEGSSDDEEEGRR
jgi:hypothetical protein